MSFPLKAKVTRVSNGTVELTPENQGDLSKVDLDQVVTLDLAQEDEAEATTKRASRKKAE